MNKHKLNLALISVLLFPNCVAIGESRKWHDTLNQVWDLAIQRQRQIKEEREGPDLSLEKLEKELADLNLPREMQKSLKLEDSSHYYQAIKALKKFSGPQLVDSQIAMELLEGLVVDHDSFEVGLNYWIAAHPEWKQANQWLKYRTMSDRELLKEIQDPTRSPKETNVFLAIANVKWKGWHSKILGKKENSLSGNPWHKSKTLLETLIGAEDFLKSRKEWEKTKGYVSLSSQLRSEKKLELIQAENKFRMELPEHLRNMSIQELANEGPFWIASAPKGSSELIRNFVELLELKNAKGTFLPERSAFEIVSVKIPVSRDGLLTRETPEAAPSADREDPKKIYKKEGVFIPASLKPKVAVIVCADGNCHNGAMENDYAWAKQNEFAVKKINSKKAFMAASQGFRKKGYPILIIDGHSGPINGIELTNKHAEKQENLNNDSLHEIAPSLVGYECIITFGCRSALHPDFGAKLSLLTDAEVWGNDYYRWSPGETTNPHIGSVEINSNWHVHYPKGKTMKLLRLLEPPSPLPPSKAVPKNFRPYPNLGPLFIRLNEDGSA